ncbi:GNAT family N-acetyltransferase [Periweissella fabalis]|uniref:GNAT family N-acetyltransferase n=1 Tax=Periweissella fabalis TaxID=1070421 RepID=A0A7X6N6E4_9LACO|nr:GNAT family N-acetyltransferase [Periweissella fabalis]MCM0599709.1 GNAT family N-acetyltransferase [Periweissella fabalis]NKZ24878.1 GNAT family N-acetyltransferase [Periweissella fabalis]
MEIELRKLEPTDFEDYWPLISDTQLAAAAGFLPVQGIFAGQVMFQAALTRDLTYLIIYQGMVIGSIAFEADNTLSQCLEIGYLLLPEYWNQGLMTQAVTQAIAIAFKKLHIQTLWARVIEPESASAAVLRKNGFIQQKHLPNESSYKFILQC